jgi:hypothetical protein
MIDGSATMQSDCRCTAVGRNGRTQYSHSVAAAVAAIQHGCCSCVAAAVAAARQQRSSSSTGCQHFNTVVTLLRAVLPPL